MSFISLQNVSHRLIRVCKFNKINICKFASTSSTKPESGNEEGSAREKTDKVTKKLRAKTPIGKLDELDAGKHPYQEKEPLPEWPDNTNPHTGEIGGPRGPEPTRYGDWERKGRVTDF